MPARSSPRSSSAAPRPYTFAVSTKVIPSSNARSTQAAAVSRATPPPYVSHEPRPISETISGLVPSRRYSMQPGLPRAPVTASSGVGAASRARGRSRRARPGEKSSRSSVARFCSSCATLLAPTSVEVTRASRSVQASAIWASDWPRPTAIPSSARSRETVSSVIDSGASESFRLAREPSGIPSRYLSVSRPCASGEKTMQPTPSSPSASSRSGSIQRLSSEYEGWWIRSGVPSERRIAAASRVCSRRVGRDAGVERLALADGAVERTQRLLQRRLRIRPVRVEDVDVVEPHPREALVEAREQVLARAPLAVGAGPHVVAGLRRDDQLVPVGPEVVARGGARRSPPRSRRAARSCSRDRSA